MVANAPEIDVASATMHAPAKLNLTLQVAGKRSDGFHELHSLVLGIDLTDALGARLRDDDRIVLDCTDATLSGDDNLAKRAAARLQAEGRCDRGLTLKLDKSIPVGGGLGGGSSDAAAALMLGNALWSLGYSNEALAALGAELGSDVPLFFNLPAAVITGRGERVDSVKLSWSGWALLVFVSDAVSTPAVYAAWSHEKRGGRGASAADRILDARSAEELMAAVFNDLEPAVRSIAPRVGGVLDSINRMGLGPIRISGAGSTLFQLHDEEEAARHAARAIEAADIGVTTRVVAAPRGTSAIRSEE